MKVAISALGSDLDSQVDARFGRAQNFFFIDTKTMKFEVVSNESAGEAMHGAGIQTSQLISKKGVAAVITGNVGPNAFQTLSAAEILIYHAGKMSVLEAVEAFNNGELKQITQSGPAHGGMGGR
jgi:predicted Fe-Mo cluster-binding NifX family protein